jgi:hypothetical protein
MITFKDKHKEVLGYFNCDDIRFEICFTNIATGSPEEEGYGDTIVFDNSEFIEVK